MALKRSLSILCLYLYGLNFCYGSKNHRFLAVFKVSDLRGNIYTQVSITTYPEGTLPYQQIVFKVSALRGNIYTQVSITTYPEGTLPYQQIVFKVSALRGNIYTQVSITTYPEGTLPYQQIVFKVSALRGNIYIFPVDTKIKEAISRSFKVTIGIWTKG